MKFCIPQAVSKKLKELAKSGDWSIPKLYEMNSETRRAYFTKHAGKELGQEINTRFEKAISSDQKNALNKWVVGLVGVDKEIKMRIKEKIEKIKDLGMLDKGNEEAFLSDLVREKLGVNISKKEAVKIYDISQELGENYKKMGNEFKVDYSNKESMDNMLEFLKTQKKMDDYMNSLRSSSILKIFLSTIGRGMMLLSFKSPLLNVMSNIIFGGSEMVARRVSMGFRFRGANNDMLANYIKYTTKVFNETGYDLTRTLGFDDLTRVLGEKTTNTQGAGRIRAVGRFIEDVVFKKMQGVPDVFAASIHMYDTADLISTAIARNEKLSGKALKDRARNILTDALNINPKTDEGKIVRLKAIEDASYATLTNDGNLAKMSLAIREAVNKAPMSDGLGEYLIPFAKTPSNAIEAQLDYAGLGAVKALKNVVMYAKTKDPANLTKALRQSVRAGVGIVGGLLLLEALNPDEYIGDYPTTPKERALLSQKNATPNSVKVGNKYISLTYLGPYATVVTGLLQAKKFEKMSEVEILDYGRAMLLNAKSTPGVSELEDIYDTLTEMIKKGENSDEMKNQFLNNLASGISSRLMPAIVSDMAKMIDTYERKIDYKQPMTSLQAVIPIWRQGLEKKVTPLDQEKRISPIEQLLFGSRVKTANEDQITKEIKRLESGSAKNIPTISDPRNTKNSRFYKLKEQKGIVAQTNAYEDYLKGVKKRWAVTITKSSYKKMTDEEKTKELNKIREEEIDKVFEKSAYKIKK